MQAINRTRGQTLIEKGTVARTAEERRRGLIGRSPLARGEGMFLPGTKSIHTFGMGFAIDVTFLDSQGRVIHLIEKMNCSRVSALVWRSAMVLEMPAGTLARSGTELGDQVELVEDDAPITPGEQSQADAERTR